MLLCYMIYVLYDVVYIYIYAYIVNFQFPAYPYASCQGGRVNMSHVRHSIHWVCNLPSVATLKAQARGLLQRVWSRKSHLQRLGRIGCWSHRRGHLWKNLNYSWFRGPFHITVIRASTTFNQLLTLESYWIISVPYLCGQSTLVAELRAPWGFFSGSGGPTIFSDCNWDFFSTKWSNFVLLATS